LLVVGPVRAVHHELPLAAGAELERARRGGEPLRTPPPRQVPHLGERLEHQLPRGVDDPRDHDLPVRRLAHPSSPSCPACLRSCPAWLRSCLACLRSCTYASRRSKLSFQNCSNPPV